VPDLELAPELWAAELSRTLELVQAESGLELERNLGLELELELAPDWGA
jgi:hypothetical protein